MKDVEQFERELTRPIGGIVTEDDLEADAESFMAFTAAFGVRPPSAIRSADEEPSPTDEADSA